MLEQKARWQHLVLFLAAVLLLSGGIILSIHLSGNAKPKTWIGACVRSISGISSQSRRQ